ETGDPPRAQLRSREQAESGSLAAHRQDHPVPQTQAVRFGVGRRSTRFTPRLRDPAERGFAGSRRVFEVRWAGLRPTLQLDAPRVTLCALVGFRICFPPPTAG